MSNTPQSRNEAILQATIDGTPYTAPPQSRIEALLIQLKEVIEAGGGGGGTTNYNALSNKPQIASTTLEGNLSLADLGIQGALTFDNSPTEDSANPVKSGGIYTSLEGKQDTLTFDDSPTKNSANPVKSGGVYTALGGKQDTLTFDNSPTENSANPVKSGGIYTALLDKVDTLVSLTSTDDLDDIKTSGFYKCTAAAHSPVTNVSLLVMGYDSNNCHQQAVDIATGDIYHRSLIGGTWGSWATAMNLIHS